MAGELPAADYIKTDCESFDPEVLRGTRRYLAQSNILSLTVETDFSVSGTYPRTPFVEISDIAVQHRLLVFDINVVRHPRPPYVAARERHPWPPADPMHDMPYLDVGQPLRFCLLSGFRAGAQAAGNFCRCAGCGHASDNGQTHQSHDQFRIAWIDGLRSRDRRPFPGAARRAARRRHRN